MKECTLNRHDRNLIGQLRNSLKTLNQNLEDLNASIDALTEQR